MMPDLVQTLTGMVQRWAVVRKTRVFLLVSLVLGVFIPLQTVSLTAAQRTPRLTISVPSTVRLDESIAIELTIQNAQDLAGYEAILRFDPRSAEYAGVEQRNNVLKRNGRDIGALGAVERADGVSFGFYSCPMNDCVRRTGLRQRQGHRGTLRLATVMVQPTRTGLLDLVLDAPRFVDATGTPLAVQLPPLAMTVRVGSGSARIPAPPSVSPPVQAPSVASPSARVPQAATGPFDLTDDGLVTHADAMTAAVAWATARSGDGGCTAFEPASLDVNHDGCLDVADLQAIVAHYSAPATPRQRTQPQTSLSGLMFVRHTARRNTINVPAVQVGAAQIVEPIVVTSTEDAPDAVNDGRCATAGGVCTLRAAIEEANTQSGPNTILFNILGSGPHILQLIGQLPALTDESGGTTIDGYSQPGALPNTDPFASNAVIKIQLTGQGPEEFSALPIASANNRVQGLAFSNLRRGIWINGGGAFGNVLAGNFIGTTTTGTANLFEYINGASGVYIQGGAHDNVIGGSLYSERNVISGNAHNGVVLWDAGTNTNRIINNIIGLSPSGTRRVRNLNHGIDINAEASSNVVGGTTAAERNVVSGNTESGVEISHGYDTLNNLIVGNVIGTDVTGTSGPTYAVNGLRGVNIEDGVRNNQVYNNVIGNNANAGVSICCRGTTSGNQVYNNYIGITPGDVAIPNGTVGVLVAFGVNRARIGPNNIIANNPAGVRVLSPDTRFVTITRNSIYNNTGLGIDLDPLGSVNPNDTGDKDNGANVRRNFPVLDYASQYEVRGTACVTCTVEVFVADSGANEYGEGRTFVGSGTVESDGRFRALLTNVTVGDYVTAVAIDTAGNTSEFALNRLVVDGPIPPTSTPIPTRTLTPTRTPTPTPYLVPTTIAEDRYSRTISGGWGEADTGGAYTLTGTSADFNVNGTTGTMRNPSANTTRAATLDQVSAQDVDMLVRVESNQAATGGGQFMYLVARRTSATSEYRGQLRFDASGAVGLRAQRVVNGTASAIGNEVVVSGLTHTANQAIWVRMQVVGTSPTTLRVRAWADGQAEPTTWTYRATNSEASLQTTGRIGLRTFVSSNTTNAPIVFAFDNLEVAQVSLFVSPTPTSSPTITPTSTPTPTPTAVPTPSAVASDTYSRNNSSGWGEADTGGAYTLTGTSADFNVNGTTGTIRNPNANTTRAVTLDQVSVRDVDVLVRVESNKVATGGGQFVYVVTRRVSTTSEYRGQLRFDASGAVGLRAQRVVNGTVSAIGNEVVVSGLTHTANQAIWVRMQVVGTSPTTLRVRAWADGQAEPTTWTYRATNSEASLQTAGRIGLRTFVSSNTTNAPIVFAFDNLEAIDIQGQP